MAERTIPEKLRQRMATAIALVDHDRCVGCSYCELACPYDTIDLVAGLATIRSDCTACWVCLSYCPVDAISQADRVSIDQGRAVPTSPPAFGHPLSAGGEEDGG